MKTFPKILVASLAMIMIISFKPINNSDGPHGGKIKPSGNYNIELNSTSETIYAYLLDKNSASLPNKNVQCEIKFIFSDSSSTILPLKPYNNDGFSMSVGFLKFYTCRVYFTVGGKMVSAQFENDNLIVDRVHEKTVKEKN